MSSETKTQFERTLIGIGVAGYFLFVAKMGYSIYKSTIKMIIIDTVKSEALK